MPKDKKPLLLAEWVFPETENHKKGKGWYFKALILFFALLIYAIVTANFLFAAIIVMISFIYAFSSFDKPLGVRFRISEDGIRVGRKFYKFSELRSFWIIYEPRENVKNLYFDFTSRIKPTLTIPLKEENPLRVRDILLDYLPEDVEKEDEPLSDIIERVMKL